MVRSRKVMIPRRLRMLAMPLLLTLGATEARAQSFALERVNDSLNYVTLGADRWALPYPVYQFQTGDVDGDGREEALVGVIKSTRYYHDKGRRLFVFKNHRGRVRPLWLGSRLGGVLHDFRFEAGQVVTREETSRDSFAEGRYAWNGFGFTRKEINQLSK